MLLQGQELPQGASLVVAEQSSGITGQARRELRGGLVAYDPAAADDRDRLLGPRPHGGGKSAAASAEA